MIITHLYSNNKILFHLKKFSNKLIIIEDTAINLGAKLNNGKNLELYLTMDFTVLV